jgi:hypothetical protein
MLQEQKTTNCWVEAEFQLATGDAFVRLPVSPVTHRSSDYKYRYYWWNDNLQAMNNQEKTLPLRQFHITYLLVDALKLWA